MNAPHPTPTHAPQAAAAPTGGRLFVLIPSAGVGSRAQAQGQPAWPKQYQMLCGQPVLAHTLAAFGALAGMFSGVSVVVAPEDALIADVVPDLAERGVTLLRCGGATRADSVLQGLRAWRALPDGPCEDDWVLVHDAARCLVTPALIARLVEACRHDAVGGLLALPLPDTLKAERDGRVDQTLDRSGKWLAQTPQMFRLGALTQALALAQAQGQAITDEASAMEAQNLAPRLVPASAQNFKITYPEDFSLAEAVLRARQASLAPNTDTP